jgi:hypothetical protein
MWASGLWRRLLHGRCCTGTDTDQTEAWSHNELGPVTNAVPQRKGAVTFGHGSCLLRSTLAEVDSA